MSDDRNAELDRIELWRCPQLGGPVTFGYCRVMNEGRFCGRTVKCWGGTAVVVEYLERRFTAEELAAMMGAQGTDRVGRIVDAVKRAKDAQEE
jgi:hypothetical protein